MSTVLPEHWAEATSTTPDGNSLGALFVSTGLDSWIADQPEMFARDCRINDTVYRKLDPEYYAWLSSRMVLADKAAMTGHLDAAAFETLRERFNAVHDWAVESFGEGELLAAARRFHSGDDDYRPPRPEAEGGRSISYDEWLRRRPVCTEEERDAYHRQREAEREKLERIKREKLKQEKLKKGKLTSRKRRG